MCRCATLARAGASRQRAPLWIAGIARMSERVWDGRGDALDDARLTTVDGRMADDMRLKLPHFRVMAHVGRQNGRRGWLRVSQSELAERWGCHRNTVNRAFGELVAWSYLAQRTQHEAGESFCQYKVRLDGEDGPLPERAAQPEGCTPESAPPSEGSAQQDVHPCTAAEYTRAQRESAPPIYRARAHRLSPTDADNHPPLPSRTLVLVGEGEGGRAHGGKRHGLTSRGWASRWDTAARNAVEDLLATPAAAVATRLLVPLVGTLSPPKGVHGASWVREVAELLGDVAPEVLDELARGLRLTRKCDLPFAADLPPLARKAAAAVASGAAGRARGGSQRGDTGPSLGAWLDALGRDDAVDLTVLVSRALLGRLGPETTWAWFRSAKVLHDWETGRLVVQLPGAFVARTVAQRYAADLVLAARTLWPEITEADLAIVEETHAA